MGLTVLDAGVVIGFLESRDAHHAAARQVMDQARNAGDQLALPASAYAEVLVGPVRRGADAVAVVEQFVAKLPVEVLDLDREIALDAAHLRARHGATLRLPDALVIATARRREAELLVTTDRGWPSGRVLGLAGRLVVLQTVADP